MRIELANLRQTILNFENDFTRKSRETTNQNFSQNPPPIPPRTVVTIPTPKMSSQQEMDFNNSFQIHYFIKKYDQKKFKILAMARFLNEVRSKWKKFN